MTDLTPIQQIIAPASDRLCGDDLIAGPRTIRFTEVRAIEGERGKKQFSIRFEGDNGRPWIPCKTMARAMVLAWGVTDEAQMVGRSVTVYRDPDVNFGAEKGIGGVRISHMSHLPKAAAMKLTVAQGKKGQFVFQPLVAEVREIKPDTDPAAEWVTKFARNASNAESLAAIAKLEGNPRLAELATKRPELHQRCMDALNIRRVELDQPEGRDDADMGDQFGGDDAAD